MMSYIWSWQNSSLNCGKIVINFNTKFICTSCAIALVAVNNQGNVRENFKFVCSQFTYDTSLPKIQEDHEP
jgi:hypothetical protein